MELTTQEIAHLLAALRDTQSKPWKVAQADPLVAVGQAPLEPDQVDALCMDINCGDVEIEDLNDHQIAHIRAALEYSATADLSGMDHFDADGLEPLDEEQVYDLSARLLALTSKPNTPPGEPSLGAIADRFGG